MKRKLQNMTRIQTGYSLLEVLIGIAIFAIGMLALASLQGNLTRSASDAAFRTVAINLAEELIEGQRGFARLNTDPNGVFPAYQDISSGTAIVNRGGVDYTVVGTSVDYYYDRSGDNFTTTQPTTVIISDYKLLTLTVSWSLPEFRTNEGQQTTNALGSGSITLSETISSLTSAAAAKAVVQPGNEPLPTPPVDYSPGQNPDIVSMNLGQNKFKESLTPQPDVIRQGELVETRFDVITYSQTGNGALFLRREEFVGVSCECELVTAPDADDAVGQRPTVWAGDEYSNAEIANKAYGLPANNFQSSLCDTCCKDHHDGGTAPGDPVGDPGITKYDPFRPATEYWVSGDFAGDHKHYKKDNRGVLTVAQDDGDVYVEACKMVRKDGFFRVTQDFRREGLNVFQYDFLDETSEVDRYSSYVTGEISNFESLVYDGYEAAPPTLTPPGRTPSGVNPAPATDLTAGYTHLPTPLGANFQQLRSRGIYLDYLSEDLRSVINCLQASGTVAGCASGDVVLDQTGSNNILELIPFFDVQLTYLTRWSETPPNDPLETSNEPLESDNTHSRGVVARTVNSAGAATVTAKGHTGVLGLTDTDPINLDFNAEVSAANIQVIVNTNNPPNPQGRLITGTIKSGVNFFQGSSADITGFGALCERSPDGFLCLIPNSSSNPVLRVSNYKKPNRTMLACSGQLTGTTGFDANNSPFTDFVMNGAVAGVDYVISIEEDACTIAP